MLELLLRRSLPWCCAAALAAGTALAQSPSPQTAPLSKAPSLHPLTKAAFAAGVLTCARQINAVSHYLSGTASSSSLLFPPSGEPDRHPLSASLELAGTGQDAYVSATFSPSPNGSCDAAYDAVMWWPSGCDAVARASFAALKPQQTSFTKLRVLGSDDNNMRVFLMPAGTGCVSIKKEVIR